MSLMERLLKTLRYNFLTEALDFVGVHQERTLQVRGCLSSQKGILKAIWQVAVGLVLSLPSSLRDLKKSDFSHLTKGKPSL